MESRLDELGTINTRYHHFIVVCVNPNSVMVIFEFADNPYKWLP